MARNFTFETLAVDFEASTYAVPVPRPPPFPSSKKYLFLLAWAGPKGNRLAVFLQSL